MGLFNRRNANPDQPQLPFMKSAVIALLRHLLTFIGGTLVAKGLLDTTALQEIIGALITFLSVGWMTVEKVKGKPEAPKA